MLYSTLKVSSVQDKKQCDPEEAAAKGKTTWGKWAVEQQNPLFSCQERSRCSFHSGVQAGATTLNKLNSIGPDPVVREAVPQC